ncbi:NAD-P-binding protein [Vararia minispora EC-137]|uniref:NAD-P-binding protein n=1 Tax=Vararia minispora EC-137 TaxID=1314806 RepID=A0ACB8QWX2_9AGAM|nr:NAD-P-binding protein [Vararia minispora EC-137]
MNSIIGIDEVAAFSDAHSVYPLIDPEPLFAAQAFKGQVVLVTGASRGIGLSTALFYARAGADLLLVSRKRDTLEATKAEVQQAVPNARIELFEADVAHPSAGADAVKKAVDVFGKLDVLVANAGIPGAGMNCLVAEKDPIIWWHTQEVNVRGVFVFIHAALPELVKTKGQIVITSSGVAHLRIPQWSEYCLSKHTINRLAELVSLEYPDVKIYPVHPGVVATQLAEESGAPIPTVDPPELMAATATWLTARNAEFLSGRYVSAAWDLNEVLAKKDEIVRENLLVTKLATPSKA